LSWLTIPAGQDDLRLKNFRGFCAVSFKRTNVIVEMMWFEQWLGQIVDAARDIASRESGALLSTIFITG
jgi:hypothetical protein